MNKRRYVEKAMHEAWLFVDEQYRQYHAKCWVLEQKLNKVTKQRDILLSNFIDNGIVDWD